MRNKNLTLARMAELADALLWGGSEHLFVWVQIPFLAPNKKTSSLAWCLFILLKRGMGFEGCVLKKLPVAGFSAPALRPQTGKSHSSLRLRFPKNPSELRFNLEFFDRCPALIVRFIFHRKRSQTRTKKLSNLIGLLNFLSKPTKKAWHVINALAHCM